MCACMAESDNATDSGKEKQFIANRNSGRLHRGTPESGPECGANLSASPPATVNAETEEEAVMRYNLIPCINCIEDHYKLNRWRRDVHSATVMHGVDTPERWQDV